MKNSLPEKSKEHESRIKEIADIIVGSAKDKIAFVILFGSFARGSWVRDRYVEEGITYEYASDYDFLVITRTNKQANGNSGFELERKIKEQIKEVGYLDSIHKTHIIIEGVDLVNDEIEKSQYFFSDIKKEGIVFYDSGEFKLSEAQKLHEKERKRIAKEDYEHWSKKAERFLRYVEVGVEEKDFSGAAFNLHQATESLYNCALLSLTSYKPKSHNLEELNQLCSTQSNDFLTTFPLATEEQKECFKLLRKAYIDARYNKNYTITNEQLKYLIGRVEKLKQIVEKICKEKTL